MHTALYTPLYRAYGAAHIGTPCRGTARREVITGGLLITNQSNKTLDSSTLIPYNIPNELSRSSGAKADIRADKARAINKSATA